MRWPTLEMVSLLPLLSLTSTAVNVVHRTPHPDAETDRVTTAQMLQMHGYRVQEHFAITEDGYVLRMFRIPPADPEHHLPLVFVQHGLLSSSDDWVVNGPHRALAYVLADAGFDVWMGNGRGNVYSRHHVRLNSKHSKFWKFSWHEQGLYDVPAMIDHILHVTGHKQLFYIGHSMGTTMFFVMLSERPEYNEKIKAAFLMAPVAYMRHVCSNFLKLLAEVEGPLAALLDLLGVDEFEPSNELTKKVTDITCADGSLVQNVCSNIVFNIAGYNEKEINESMLPTYLAHSPAGASVLQIDHYGQEIKTGGQFRQYDFGPLGNMQRYGSRTPPSYQLSAVTAPVALYYGSTDCLARERDVEQIYHKIKNPIGMFRVPKEEFSHLDFIWGIHARELVYEKILKQMRLFLNHNFNKTRTGRRHY